MNDSSIKNTLQRLALLSDGALFAICGPCAIESREFALETAAQLKAIFAEAGLPFIYKSSFDKANRSSGDSFRGVGLDEGLAILGEIRETLDIPVLTDVHEACQVEPVAAVVDVLQTPAFLCRQTDFIAAVARAGKPVNIKKGQFLAPSEMANVIDKARQAARNAEMPNDHFLACERGTSFGYGNLVVDMRGLQIMAETTGAPVIFDATHSVQLPGAQGTSSDGQREFVPHLARAAVATGAVSGLFIEAHPCPEEAPCDGPNMVPFADLPKLLCQLKAIHATVREG
ncbi:3-deoxy-8-phosphooctulonate synthase [Halorhodospira abdelmalekii]|uniref:3-deoxy-8-phosphooctulonate synthase n=1 Tax=Halorhodospira abdelmalekii TaxID=421629 RepID=UPI0019043315|nr:3-deoxy-8-phosphooctulonate synthase [Halorhodospira abdelmalekii]MBK1735807.1 3-deoxy-8-phosphooctulonate synthase [Halorhodospira abdelmalekii]